MNIDDSIMKEQMKNMTADEEEDDIEMEYELPHFNPYEEQEDELAFPEFGEKSPRMSQIQSWKKQFGEIFCTPDPTGDGVYVWRCLNRYEYKQILSIPNTDPLQREEMICEQCVLWPENFTYETMAKGKAGIPAMLAEQIMEYSGFTRASQPIKL